MPPTRLIRETPYTFSTLGKKERMKIHDADIMNFPRNLWYKSDFAILYCVHNFIVYLKNVLIF